jgi:hypothetical protein
LNKDCIYQPNVNRSVCLWILLLLFLVPGLLVAQDELLIRSLISEADLKKLGKADGYKAEADGYIEEANQLNMEVFSIKANPELDEKAIAKKTTKLESEALKKQVQAAALYEKCNEIKFILYKKYLDAFWNEHEGEESNFINAKLLEEQASDYYFQAVNYRIEARKMDAGYAQVEKLTEANNLEINALQNQISALATYHGLGERAEQKSVVTQPDYTPPETAEPSAPVEQVPYEPVDVTREIPGEVISKPSDVAESTIPGQVIVNQSMIDAYNRYITTGQFTDSTLSTGQIASVTSFDTERLLQLWYEYVYGDRAYSNVREAEDVESIAEPAQEITDVTDTGVAHPGEEVSKEVVPVPSDETEIGIVTDENKGVLVPADDEVIYRVQVAANRSELSQRTLRKMYYGNKSVEMINENGWYKYSVGDFSSYEEANQFRKSSGVNNAFVVAYRKGTRFQPGSADVVGTPKETYTSAGEQKLPSGLIFRIQIAASRVPLNMGQLKAIYKGTYPVEMISEEGWYKYQFMGVRLYSDVLQMIRQVTTSGAFVVAYEDGIKINLADAVKKSKETENKVKSLGRKGTIQEIEFHLQLAASRIAMPPDELKNIYNGSEPVSVIYEDGWYKYHLKAGNSPTMAEKLKQACGIDKAFIVPYRRAAKINYYEALQELK